MLKHADLKISSVSCFFPLSITSRAKTSRPNMMDRAPTDDEERQLSTPNARRNGMDADRATTLPSINSQPIEPQSESEYKKLRPTEAATPWTESAYSCFLCVRGKRQTRYVIRIPCHRAEHVRNRTPKKVNKGGGSVIFVPSPERIIGYSEPESRTIERLVAACYQYHGIWKKYIPFYGITEVREIEVTTTSLTLSNGH